MDNIKCPKCGGDGATLEEEDGRSVEAACYHCANTGRISDEQNLANRIEALALKVAAQKVDRQRKACDENPDGEGWAFQAAEAGVQVYDYTQSCIIGEFTNVRAALAEFQDNEPQVFEALLDLLVPDEAVRLPEKAAPAKPAPSPSVPF